MTVGVGDVVRFVAEWDIPDGTIAQLVYHFFGVSGTTATDAQVGIAGEAALTTAWALIAAEISDQVTGATFETYLWDFVLNRWDGIDVQLMIGQDGLTAVHMLPHGAAALVKIFTDAARRQGRKYVHGMIEDSIADGTFDGVALTALALFGAALDNGFVAGGLTMGFCTFNTEPTSPLFETTSPGSGAVQAEGIAAYQRRRRPGTGI